MLRRYILLFILTIAAADISYSQVFVSTADLFKPAKEDNRRGSLLISQDPAVDTLISRYILSKSLVRSREGHQGMDGFRIQIYYSSIRSAREESAKIRADFISKFPDILSYAQYVEPGWFMVRAGDYRTKAEGYSDLLRIRQAFPNAYFVPDVINFPDLIQK